MCCCLILMGTDVSPGQSNPGTLQRFEIKKRQMGVQFGFVVYASDLDKAKAGITAVFERIAELEDRLSDYDATSELMQLCRGARAGVPHPVSKDLLHVLILSREISRTSQGAFDPTVGHLSRLWRNARKSGQVPSQAAIDQARAEVDWKQIRIDRKKKKVTLQKEGMQIDLGGIAKGFAADQAIQVFRDHGLPRCLVDASGDVTVGDPPPGRKGWRIAVGGREGERVVLANGSVASSGDRYQYLEHDNVRYSHILNPATGWGMTDRRLVTVISRDPIASGALADSLASAFSVLPVDRMQDMAEQWKQHSVRVQRIRPDKPNETLFVSPNFETVQPPGTPAKEQK